MITGVVIWIETVGVAIAPYTNWLGLLGGLLTGATGAWGWLKRDMGIEREEAQERLSSLKAKLAKERKVSKELEERLTAAEDSLPNHVLQKVKRENKDGNFERAAREVEVWLGLESDSIAELCCRAAKWRLAFADSDHDERLALTDALRMASVAANSDSRPVEQLPIDQ